MSYQLDFTESSSTYNFNNFKIFMLHTTTVGKLNRLGIWNVEK